MTIAPGVYELDPESADLVVRTGTEGAAAAMGNAANSLGNAGNMLG